MMIRTIDVNKHEKLRVALEIILSMTIALVCLVGCATARKVDPSTLSKYEGFLHDGATTKQEIQERLGEAQSVYENGRTLIYHVYLRDDGQMTLMGGGACRGACHACVLVFDEDSVLERHSLVKYGCR
jgi:hypothetical protein